MSESWTAAEASALLHQAFPWRVAVDTDGGGTCVSLRFGIVEDPEPDGRVLLRFERNPEETQQWASRHNLITACETGRVMSVRTAA